MNKQHLNFFLSISLIIGACLFAASIVQATSKEDITYPVAELGDCKDETACRRYCDRPDNFPACFKFARVHNLLEGPIANVEEDDIDHFAEVLKNGGPGGCTTQNACEDFCNNAANMGTCIEFAETNNLIPPEELAEVRKVKAALDRGVALPPGCTNKITCEEVCEHPKDSATARGCFVFAREAGLLPPEFDNEKTEKMFELIDRGEIDFGAMKQCEKLQDGGEEVDDATLEKCLNLGEQLGFMKPGEKEFARKMMRGGIPGHCRGPACRNFCEREENKDICFAHFESQGLLPPEAKEQMQDGLKQMREGLRQVPPEVLECAKEKLPELAAILDGAEVKPSEMRKIGSRMGPAMQECFASAFGGSQGNFGPPGEENERGFPEGEFPGGADLIGDCMKAAGFEWPPQGPPSEEMQAQIPRCAQEAGAGQDDRQGFPLNPGEFPGGAPGGFPAGSGGFPQNRPGFPGGANTTPFVGECMRELGLQGSPSLDDTTKIEECVRHKFGGGVSGEQGGDFSSGSPPISDPDQGRICAERGGAWNGTICEYPTIVPPSSGDYEDRYREEYQRQCVEQGGTWDGSTCQHSGSPPPFPPESPPSPPQSLRNPSFLRLLSTVILNFFGVPVRQ